jgi:nitroimidazol reductase NimA-like FMN-containing flavoprotein (pyridoxamine 5'-phosphate oxidase superfamily)
MKHRDPNLRRRTMLVEMKQLVKEKNICVLATIAGHKPYCSLMAYASNEDCTEIYMATHRSTRKFRNISENPAVSLMIDTREEVPRTQARALTVEGACTWIEDPSKKQLAQARLLSRHPHLKEFLSHIDNEILCVRIGSFLLLKGLTEAHHATVE